MGWLSDRWDALEEAVGLRRLAIGGSITGTLNVANIIASYTAGMWMGPVAAWAIAVANFLALLFWWTLNYATELRNKTKPKIGVEVDRFETEGISGGTYKWARLEISALTDAALKNCQARLTRLERVGKKSNQNEGTMERGSIGFRWSNEGQTKSKTVFPGVPDTVDVLSCKDLIGEPYLCTAPEKQRLNKFLLKPATYRLQIAVTAENCPPVHRWFLFDWGGFDNFDFREQDVAR